MNPTRLILLCLPAGSALRRGRFPADEALEAFDSVRLAAVPRTATARWRSPARAARQLADALALAAEAEPALAELDYGRWAGRSLKSVEAAEAPALATWLAAPAAAPHGGESFNALRARVGAWLARQAGAGGEILVITHASVIRAAVAEVLELPADAHAALDVVPLSLTQLSAYQGRWRLLLGSAMPPAAP